MALPVTTINPQAPEWAKWTVIANQQRMDNEYLAGSGNSVAHWVAVCAAWKVTQTQARAASADPANYQAPPPDTPMPKREISDWIGVGEPGADSMGFTVTSQAYPDITPLPHLDAWVAPTPVPPWPSGGAQAQQDTILNLLGQILSQIALLRAGK